MPFSLRSWIADSAGDLSRAIAYGEDTWRMPDDRERVVSLFEYTPPALLRREDAFLLPDEDIKWIRRELRKRGVISGRWFSVVLMCALAPMLYLHAARLIQSGFALHPFSRWMTPIGLTVLLVALSRDNRGFGTNPHALRSVFLLRSRCPSCGHHIAAIPPDPDGCTVCPECGSAWRLPSSPPVQT